MEVRLDTNEIPIAGYASRLVSRVEVADGTGLERAKAQGRVGGRPKVKRERDKDAKRIRQMRDEGQSYREIAEELGRSTMDVYRVGMTLGCTGREL